MAFAPRWTTADVQGLFRKPGARREIIDRELHVSTPPSRYHQRAADNLVYAFRRRDPGDRLGTNRTVLMPGFAGPFPELAAGLPG